MLENKKTLISLSLSLAFFSGGEDNNLAPEQTTSLVRTTQVDTKSTTDHYQTPDALLAILHRKNPKSPTSSTTVLSPGQIFEKIDAQQKSKPRPKLPDTTSGNQAAKILASVNKELNDRLSYEVKKSRDENLSLAESQRKEREAKDTRSWDELKLNSQARKTQLDSTINAASTFIEKKLARVQQESNALSQRELQAVEVAIVGNRKLREKLLEDLDRQIQSLTSKVPTNNKSKAATATKKEAKRQNFRKKLQNSNPSSAAPTINTKKVPSFDYLAKKDWKEDKNIAQALTSRTATLTHPTEGQGTHPVEMDEYSIKVKLPKHISPEVFLTEFLKDPNTITDSSMMNILGSFNYDGNSTTAPKIGDVWEISFMGAGKGHVMLVERNPAYFVFATMSSKSGTGHPERGIRLFGFEPTPDGYTRFFTRGLSRSDFNLAENADPSSNGNLLKRLKVDGEKKFDTLMRTTQTVYWREVYQNLGETVRQLGGTADHWPQIYQRTYIK